MFLISLSINFATQGSLTSLKPEIMKSRPAIVVTAYNRPRSLKRILASIAGMKAAADVPLIISIDNKAPDNQDVLAIANDFKWPFGEKEVIYRPEHMGLRKHILACGDLSRRQSVDLRKFRNEWDVYLGRTNLECANS